MKLNLEQLINWDGNKIDVTNKNVVVYFYPKDDTPGCTIEANDFTKLVDEFNEVDAVIIGVSNDNCASHQKFISKYGLKINLISSENSSLIENFDVIKEKTFMVKPEWG